MTERRSGVMTTPIGTKRQRQQHTTADESWTPGGRPSSGTAIPQGYSPRASLTLDAVSTTPAPATATSTINRRRDARRPAPLQLRTTTTPPFIPRYAHHSHHRHRGGGGNHRSTSPQTATTPYGTSTNFHHDFEGCGGEDHGVGGIYSSVSLSIRNQFDPHLGDRLQVAADEFWSPSSSQQQQQQQCMSDTAPDTPLTTTAALTSPQLTANDISYHSALREALMPLSQRSQGRDPISPLPPSSTTATRRRASSFTPITPQRSRGGGTTSALSPPVALSGGGELRLWKALSHPFSEYSNFRYTHMTMFSTNVILVSTPANLIHYDIDRRESTILSIYDSPFATHNCVVRQMFHVPQSPLMLEYGAYRHQREKFVLAFAAPMVREAPFELEEEEGNRFPFDETVERDGEVGALQPRSRAIRAFLERSAIGWESPTTNAPRDDKNVVGGGEEDGDASAINAPFHEDVVSAIYIASISPSVPSIGATKVPIPFPVSVVATHPTCTELVVVGSASGPCICTIDTSLVRKKVKAVMRGTLSGSTNDQIGAVSCICVTEVNNHHQLVIFGTTLGHVFIFHLATGAQRAHMYLGCPIITIAHDKWLVVCTKNGQVRSYSLNLPFLQRGSEVIDFGGGGGGGSNSSVPDAASLFDEVSTADMEIPITTLAVSVSSLDLFADHEPFAAIGMANGEVRLVTLPDLHTISTIVPPTALRGSVRDHHKDIQNQGVTTLVLGPIKPAVGSIGSGSSSHQQQQQGGEGIDEIGLIVERLNRNIEPFQIHSRLPRKKRETGGGATSSSSAPWNPSMTWLSTHSDRCR